MKNIFFEKISSTVQQSMPATKPIKSDRPPPDRTQFASAVNKRQLQILKNLLKKNVENGIVPEEEEQERAANIEKAMEESLKLCKRRV